MHCPRFVRVAGARGGSLRILIRTASTVAASRPTEATQAAPVAVAVTETRAGSFTVSRKVGGSSSPACPPLVVLLGWVGSDDKHVAKYARLAHDLGVSEVRRATAPTIDVFVTRWRLVTLARELLEGLCDGTPAVVLVYSNGGAFVWGEALSLLAADALLPLAQRRYELVNVVGVAFDSAPIGGLDGRASAAAAADVVRGIVQRGLSGSPALLQNVAGSLARGALLAWLLVAWPLVYPSHPRFLQHLAQDPRPALFVYSDDDSLTDARTVAAHAMARRAAGATVHELRLTDTPHVGHLRAEPVKYSAALQDFFASAMRTAPRTLQ